MSHQIRTSHSRVLSLQATKLYPFCTPPLSTPVLSRHCYMSHTCKTLRPIVHLSFFFLNDPATPEIYPLSLPDALPISTYALPPVAALIMLAGIYYGAQYGGSTTAILVNLPGESSSVVTVIDGYQMARKGRAGPALAAAGIGSFFAGCVGTVILAAFAPPLTEVAFKFGPAEYFSLMTLGLIGAVVLASGSLLKAIAMIVLGLLLGMVGTDVNSGVARYSFDIPELTDGIDFVVIAMGVFGYGEIIANLSKPEDEREVFAAKVTGLMPTKEDFKHMIPAMLRGTALGSALGILPGDRKSVV